MKIQSVTVVGPDSASFSHEFRVLSTLTNCDLHRGSSGCVSSRTGTESAMAASPLAIAAVSAVAAVVLHRGRTKSLREQYTAAKESLSQLTLELEAVKEELQV